MGMFDIPVPSKTDTNVPVPKTPEITVDTYNSALKKLQQSFKEGADLIDYLADMRNQLISEQYKAIDDEQEEYTENLIFESYCDGPIFEKVNDENKGEIKSIAKKIRKEMLSLKRLAKNKLFKLKGSNFTSLSFLNDALALATGFNLALLFKNLIIWGSNMWVIDPAIITHFNNSELKLKSWQTICFVNPIGGGDTIGEIKNELNNEFKNILGDKYEIGIVKVKFVLGTLRGKKEAKDDESIGASSIFTNYLMVVNEKGTPLPNKEISAEATDDKSRALVSVCSKFMAKKVDTSSEEGMIASIKNKFGKGGKDEKPEKKPSKEDKKKEDKKSKVENKNESYELNLDF